MEKTFLIAFFILLCLSTTAQSLTYITVNPHEGNAYWVGGDDEKVRLVNYANAKDITYSQLVSYVKTDNTDRYKYTSRFVCSDYAELLHNRAERAGIRSGWVVIWLVGRMPHACNVFKTTDRGIVYIDCTGSSAASKIHYDKTFRIMKGGKLVPKSLYAPYVSWYSMGTVSRYKIYW